MPAFNLGLSRHRCELRSKLNSLPSFLTYIQIGAPFVLLEGSDVDTALDAIERSETFATSQRGLHPIRSQMVP
jgi:hypothetical protein